MPTSSAPESLSRYWAKRDFSITAEPRGETPQAAVGETLSFVVQKHAASRLHYDFRLELDGVLVSWAVPKGPSFDPADKRMAIHVEDHPLSYGSFEGTIPPKQYGAGTVIVWDHGRWQPVGDPRRGLADGKLVFELHGQKLAGLWELVKIAKPGERQEPWLLFKKRDGFARPRADYDVVVALPDSVIAKPLTPPTPAPEPPSARSAASRPASAAAPAPALPGAVTAALPEALSPQLATLATAAPEDGDWVCEIKFDGYRLVTRFDGGRATLVTRGGHDWSDKMPSLRAELETLGLQSGWLDGEIVVMNDAGRPSFNALQKVFDRKEHSEALVYYLFDVPYLDGEDLRQVPLRQRRARLERLLAEAPGSRKHLRFSAGFDAPPAEVLASACQMGLEGVILKRADSPYVSRRSDSWLKLKCKRRQEFVVCGYTDRSDGAPQIGSLLLGVHDAAGALLAVGSVGTGWNAEEARELKQTLAPLERKTAPYTAPPGKPGRWSRRVAGSERWVEPTQVAEVEFAEWTADGQIRHAAWLAQRRDKPAGEVKREVERPPGAAVANDAPAAGIAGAPPAQSRIKHTPAATPAAMPAATSTALATALPPASPAARPARASRTPPAATRPPAPLKITHGERVIDATSGLTKLDLVRYYESVAEFILPHLRGRPCSLVRAPNGVAGQQFFQKHGEKIGIPGITELDAALWPAHAALLEVGNPQALTGAAQMNVVEFHTWNSTVKKIGQPDRMIFDLDPGEGTPWQHTQEAATLMRGMLTELGLASWLKTSGGKGLHVVVPITPKFDYDTVKDFSQAVVQHLAKTIPQRFVAKSGPANRVGKVFADYLRNGHGATTAVAFTARARPGLGVSMPVAWDALASLKSGAHWTIADAREWLSFQRVDPWADYFTTRQTLTAAFKRLGFSPPASRSAAAP